MRNVDDGMHTMAENIERLLPSKRPQARSVQAARHTFVYIAAAGSREIMVFAMHRSEGYLDLVQRVSVAETITPLAISPDRRYLYAGLRGDRPAIAAFAIAPATGALTALGTTPLADPPMYLATDARGAFVLSASYASATFTISPIDPVGRVAAVPSAHVSTPPRTHCIVADTSNRFLYVAALGGDRILNFHFDALAGRVHASAVPFVALPPGSGPRHIVMHPHLPFLYVNGELDGCIYAFGIDGETGRLHLRSFATMLAAPIRPAWAAELSITPDGRYLYASERNTSTLAIFAIDAVTGALARRTIRATELQPRSLAIDPAGRFLLVAGERSNFLRVYRIDAATGDLRPAHRYAVGTKPVWIALA